MALPLQLRTGKESAANLLHRFRWSPHKLKLNGTRVLKGNEHGNRNFSQYCSFSAGFLLGNVEALQFANHADTFWHHRIHCFWGFHGTPVALREFVAGYVGYFLKAVTWHLTTQAHRQRFCIHLDRCGSSFFTLLVSPSHPRCLPPRWS